MDITDRIKEIKDKLKMTAAELSEKSGVPLGTLNRILSSKQKSIKSDTLKSLAAALQVSPEFLLGSEEEKTKTEIKDYGFVRVGAVTPRVKLGDTDANAEAVKNTLIEASAKNI